MANNWHLARFQLQVSSFPFPVSGRSFQPARFTLPTLHTLHTFTPIKVHTPPFPPGSKHCRPGCRIRSDCCSTRAKPLRRVNYGRRRRCGRRRLAYAAAQHRHGVKHQRRRIHAIAGIGHENIADVQNLIGKGRYGSGEGALEQFHRGPYTACVVAPWVPVLPGALSPARLPAVWPMP